MQCPKCKSELRFSIKDSTQIAECTNCGWSVATTYVEPIWEDATIYEISISEGNLPTKTALMAISKVVGVNFLSAKSIAEHGEKGFFKGLAPEIRDKKAVLDDSGVAYSIQPDFPY
jgi:hypothetical protein